MKICYLYIADNNNFESGVDLKVKSKFDSLKDLFPGSILVQFDGKIKSPNISDSLYKIPVNYPNRNYFKQYFNQKKLFSLIGNFIKENRNTYNYFILRYPFACLSLIRLMKKNENKIIFEHNTNEITELKIIIQKNKQLIPFTFRPSILSYYISDIFFALTLEKKLGKKAIKLAAGGICVTPEIEFIEKLKYPSYKTIVISNGLNSNIKKNATNKRGSLKLKGVFIAGTYAAWHGIERIINSFISTKTDRNIELYFVGKIDKKLFKNCSEMIGVSFFFMDYLNQDNLNDFLDDMHFAIGTCALHKTRLQEGSVLKVREYLSAGLPVIIGHKDPYIESITDLKKYCLSFNADDSLLNFELIYDFVKKLYDQNINLNTDIQQQAFKYLTWKQLLKPIPTFLNNLQKTT